MSDRTFEQIVAEARQLLENPIWISAIKTNGTYSRVQDDCDGDPSQTLVVSFTPDGDAWVRINHPNPVSSLRFRQPITGGGSSPRTRNALILLAYAMMLDNQEQP